MQGHSWGDTLKNLTAQSHQTAQQSFTENWSRMMWGLSKAPEAIELAIKRGKIDEYELSVNHL